MERNATLVLDWANELDYAVWYLSAGSRIESP